MSLSILLTGYIPHLEERLHNEYVALILQAKQLEAAIDEQSKFTEDGQAYDGPRYWLDRIESMKRAYTQLEAENEELQELFVYFFGENYKELAKG